ncbi:MAG: glycosyltransferase family 2 protein [Isosphaerales bacterium]
MPVLSVIVPAHDDEATIRPALRSVEEAVVYLRSKPGHARASAEVIVVDDGSRDGTLATIIDVAQGKDLFRIFHRRLPSSPGSARNAGASLAAGDVLVFLDADDLFLEDHLVECCQALEDPAVDFVKTGVALSDPVHRDWRARIGNSLAINLAVRRRCHEFVGGFPDVHLFRRSGDAFEPWIDVFRLIEDVHYNSLLGRFFRHADLARETVRYMRRPGNSFDRQYAKFQAPPGGFRETVDLEFDFRVRLSKLILDYQCKLLESKRSEAGVPAGGR